ncbi:MAG: translation initiation factor IF-2 [Saprospiraceae bacterium]
MAKRLIKVAKDLNVGISTLVEHLQKQGFEVENSPRAKVTDEAYQVLLRDFEKSIAIKSQADQLTIGSRIKKNEAEKKEEQERERKKREEEARIRKEEDDRKKREEEERLRKELERLKREAAEEQARIQREKERAAAEEARKQKEREEAKKKLNVVGKINLDGVNRPRSKRAKPKRKPTTKPVANNKVTDKPKIEPNKVIEDNKVKKQENKPPVKEELTTPENVVETNAPAEVIRAEAPQLKGLKIKGKIDLNRFKKPKKKRKTKEEDNKDKQVKASNNKPKSGVKKEGDNDNKRRRKRRRKKVVKPPTMDTTEKKTTENKPDDKKSGDKKPGDKKTTDNKNKSNSGNNNRRRTGNSPQGPGRRKDRPRRNINRRGPAKKVEPKEVSQKEIQDKIKATMARIAGGGKNKRQRVRRSNREQKREQQEKREEQENTEVIQVTEFISVSELASLFDIAATDIIMTCMNAGIIVSINQRLDAEVIELVAEEYEHEVEFISAEEQIDEEEEEVDDPKDLKPRAPIVTVMGHVDHGKTSLLDHIRKANVADGEAGGITQHIGAYEVRVNDSKVTFLDTPGHEAFTAMRARGAKVTDVAVIIIAADDSVMPQTKEAISHAQAAGVPIVFAINKIDKPGANPERIKEQLAAMNFLVEDWGGKYQSQDISAKKGIGIEDLLEKIQLEAEILELQANPDKNAIGVILEASLDKGRGYVAKMLVQAGKLKVGDPIVAGEHAGKVKAMFNERGKRVKKVGPSTPVLVLGLSGAPQAGERFKVLDNEQDTKALANKRSQINREQQQRATRRLTLDDLGRRIKLGNFQQLNLIVKGDVDGSIEALSDSLLKQSIENLQINIVHRAVGQITESDVLLAAASDAIIIGFQVRPSITARRLAEQEGVDVRLYSVIYDAIDEVRDAMEGMLDTRKEKEVTAQIEIRDVFKISKVGTIAGCYVTEGKVNRNNFITIIRNGIVVYPTKEGQQAELDSLKRFKDDVKDVAAGYECGVKIKNYNDIKVGDVIEAYEIKEVKQTLDEFKKVNS